METRLKSFSQFTGDPVFVESIATNRLKYHVKTQASIVESVFRPGSVAHIELLAEAREMFNNGFLLLEESEADLFRTTDLGRVAEYNGRIVPLDLVLENHSLNEAEYKGKDVTIGKPMRGGSKKYYVYVLNPKTKKVNRLEFGDPGLSAKVSDPKARKSFAARHRCHEKKDRTKAGYWACRINRYSHLWGGKTYPGYW